MEGHSIIIWLKKLLSKRPYSDSVKGVLTSNPLFIFFPIYLSKNWHKYIRQQQTKISNKSLSYKLSRLSNADDVKRSDTINPEQTKDHGLFILGILESAANERKGRNTVNVWSSNYYIY